MKLDTHLRGIIRTAQKRALAQSIVDAVHTKAITEEMVEELIEEIYPSGRTNDDDLIQAYMDLAEWFSKVATHLAEQLKGKQL